MTRSESLTSVSTPVSKLRPPRVRHAEITRDLLNDPRLGACEVLAICAPAGYGKSTLAIQWASAEQRPVIWVTVDESDDDPAILLTTLCSALSHHIDRFQAPEFIAAEPALSKLVLPAFVQAVAAIDSPITVVIDDVHHLTSTSARKVLKALTEALPVGSQIAFAGRSMRAIPLPLWRGQGRVVEVLPPDLAFSDEETAAAVASFPGNLDASDVLRASDGWPVAVFLLSQTPEAQWMANIDEFIEDEVLQQMPEDLRTFVMATAAVGTVNAELAAYVTGNETASGLLADSITTVLIARDENGWYRYHPLLQDCVLGLWRRTDPAGLSQVQARAAIWYLEAGQIETAVLHAIESGDPETMGRIVWPAARIALLTGRISTVLAWLDRIGARTVDCVPDLCLTAAWANVAGGDFGSALRYTTQTIRLMPSDWLNHPQDFSIGPHLALLLGVSTLGTDNSLRSLELAKAAHAWIDVTDPVHALATTVLALNQALVGEPIALATFEQAVALAQVGITASSEVESRCLLGLLQMVQGRESAGCDNVGVAEQVWAFHDLAKMKSTRGILALARVAAASLRGREPDVREAIAGHAGGVEELSQVFGWYRGLSGAVLAFASARLGDHGAYHEYLQWCPDREGLFGQWAAKAEQEYASATPLTRLTPAELRVWELLKGRMTLNEIAGALFLSRETVKSHTGSIYRKLGVASRREAQELAESWML